jgi:hypothetical protein
VLQRRDTVIHCGSQYGLRDPQTGKLVWYTSHAEASAVEAAQLRAQIERKLKAGGTMITLNAAPLVIAPPIGGKR